jgi:serine/threonine protein kinase
VWAAGGNCLPDDVVFAFVHGELSIQTEQGIEEHLNRCADCRTVVAETARFILDSDVLVGSRTSPADGPNVAASVPEGRLLEPGTEVSRYVISGLIGVGAAGVVYGAHDPQLRRKIALKLMRPDHSLGPRAEALKARLLREARAMARLSHPNVVTVFDVGTYEDQVFIVMELVEGETLDRWLAQRTRGWHEIVRAFVDAGRGLAAAHAVQIVHRDFKPANVLVGGDGRVRVTDFGLAHPIDIAIDAGADLGEPKTETGSPAPALATWTATETGGMAGTPAFMAPEQFLRKPPVARTDQFTFCVALYMALYHRHPFSDAKSAAPRTLATLAEDVLGGRLQKPPEGTDVPPHLFDILSRGLAVDAERRFASMQDLLEALTRDHAADTKKRPSRARAAWLAAAALTAAAAAATAAATRAPQPKASADVAIVDGVGAASTSGAAPASEPAPATSDPAPPSPELRSSRDERSKTSPAHGKPKVERKPRDTPKAPKKRYEDSLKDPF